MTFLKYSLAICLFSIYFSCGSDPSATKEMKVPPTNQAAESPVSKQSADLTAKSMEALNQKKVGLIDDIESGTTNKVKTRLASETPLFTATKASNKTPVKEAIRVKDVNVAVNEKPLRVPVKEEQIVKGGKEVVTSNNNITKSIETKKEEVKKVAERIAVDTRVDHSPFDALLRKYVSNSGKVNYKGIKADQSKLDAYLKTLAEKTIQSDWTKAEKMAYWINAYNAFTIKLIVDNYPVKSITDLEGGKPWDRKWIKLGTKTYSLNNIENDILRPKYKEAAIHFAVNCAAKSCPPLLNRAWTKSNLKSNFKKQATAFINNPNYNKISGGKIEVSKIFDWYKVDFGNLIDYLNKYAATKIDAGAEIGYMEYDWRLNE